ncbi:hypothetical protein [Ruania halotolerans]|uniref:hypothetical protein n=1 Tax=Ruania halotolerans TaxID=2897773 RepID=UPI001E2B9592|nr:hypothetical protein [Ruania halotolerans]UFU06950.1 hypothetical protein LQF10_02215 [Ruania halotolerans]
MSHELPAPAPDQSGPAQSTPRGRSLRVVGALGIALVLTLLGWFSPPPAHADTPETPVVLIGVGGLAWEDIDDETPALASLTQQAVGSLVVRSVRSFTCPADGWLALNTGTRAADHEGQCRFLLEPSGSQVRGWQDYQEAVSGQNFEAQLGLFGEVLGETGTPVHSIGPGAAIAVAGSNGNVAGHTDRPADPGELAAATSEAVADSDLVVIDAGSIRNGDDGYTISSSRAEYRAEQIRIIERRVAAILDGLAESASEPVVLLAGMADSGTTPGLRVLTISGPGVGTGLLSSPSTRQEGYVLATDLQPTLTEMLQITDAVPAGATIGAPAFVADGDAGPAAVASRLSHLHDDAVHASAVRPLVPTFYAGLVALNLLLFATVAIALKRPAAARIRAWMAAKFPAQPGSRLLQRVFAQGELALGVLRVVALAIASIPVASYLANLLPWWRADPPMLALLGGTAAWIAVIVALAVLGPWRRATFGPAAVVAGATAVVLAVDVATGATLQLSAVMGVPTLVAGRFYGMNNTTFALFTTASLIVTIVLTNPLVRAGRRRLAAVVVLAVGAVVVVLDGAPSIGADFGGPPALLPAFMVMALLAAGIRLTWKRVVAVLMIAAVATMSIAFVDWLRPPTERTHLGRFFQTVLDGGLWGVIWRKLDQNISILFGNRPLTILAICGVLTVVYVLAKPIRLALTSPDGGAFAWLSGGNPISLMSRDVPMLTPGLVAAAVALGLGLAVNDSGIAIPALGVALGVPLLIAACATWMLGLHAQRDREVSAGVSASDAYSRSGPAHPRTPESR